MRLVVDASVMANALWATGRAFHAAREALESADLVAPHLIDLEVAGIARRHTRLGELDPTSAWVGLQRLRALPHLDRIAHDVLFERIWALRGNITSYDASYVALAEALGVPLVTRDRRLARAAAGTCEVVVVEP